MYRYKLQQRWGNGPLMLWLLMNPSTADENTTDPTVAKCADMARRRGFGGQFIANVCAARFTNKRQLLGIADPIGPRNQAAVLEMATLSERVVVAHGRLPGNLQHHAVSMVTLLREAGYPLFVLGFNKDGTPKHPQARGKHFVPSSVGMQLWVPDCEVLQ